MEIQVLRMNTVKINVPYNQISEARLDLRNWRIRHYPFRRQATGIEIEMFPNPKITMLLLKYPNVVDIN